LADIRRMTTGAVRNLSLFCNSGKADSVEARGKGARDLIGQMPRLRRALVEALASLRDREKGSGG
jgi:hypothetical protein